MRFVSRGTGDDTAVVSFAKTGDTTITFHATPDTAPEIRKIIPARNSVVTVLSLLGNQVKVYGGVLPYSTVKLNDEIKGKTAAAPLQIEIPPQGGTLVLSSGKQERRIFVTPLTEPRLQIVVLGDPDSASVLVLTPDVDDATVFVGNQPLKAKTRKGRLPLPSLRPGTITLHVEHEKSCTVGADVTQTLVLKAGDQKEARFVLKSLPQLRIEGAPEKAQFSISPDPKLYPVSQPIPLQPGHYTVTVSAADFLPFQRAVDLACGQEIVSLRAALSRDPNYRDPKAVPPPKPVEPIIRDTPTAPPIEVQITSPRTEPVWPAGCLKTAGEWQEAGNVCFFGGGKAPGTYSFEVQGRTDALKKVLTLGAKKVLRYGPWFIGTPESYIECQLEGDTFRWHKSGAAEWEVGGKFEHAVKAPSIRVSIHVTGANASVTLTQPEAGQPINAKFAVPGEGFGLRKGTPIREFRYSK